ncbi:Uncharacterised protein [Mycobacteroides abscessus subsp. abscessus]|nr:Uncharacterised protein [Mycobacteroides abscessus subsp. abscessus]
MSSTRFEIHAVGQRRGHVALLPRQGIHADIEGTRLVAGQETELGSAGIGGERSGIEQPCR